MSRLVEALFPAGGAVPVAGSELELATIFDDFLSAESPWNQKDLKSALMLLEYGPVIFERRLVTFSNLSPRSAEMHFARWTSSSSLLRRQVSSAFRRFLAMVFYDHPTVWPHIGFDGPLEVGVAPLSDLADLPDLPDLPAAVDP